MSLVLDIGFVIGLLLLSLIPLQKISDRVNLLATQAALELFRQGVLSEGRRQAERRKALQSIHSPTTYTVYASLTLFYMAIVGIAASLIAIWVIHGGVIFLGASEEALRSALPTELRFLVPTDIANLSLTNLFVLFLLSAATIGVGAAGLTYYLRWWIVSNVAHNRRVLIDESVARTIAFIYALSRSGMVFPEIMRTVAANRKAFGETAEEISVIVKDMDLFGADLVTAMLRVARQTPSEQFSDFAENFSNVFESGERVSDYLHDQYEQYQSERVSNQEQLLSLFAALGEAYVAGLVAGPLFFITILVIWGLVTGGLLLFSQFVVYLMIPLANIGFMAYLSSISEPLRTFESPIEKTTTTGLPMHVRLTSDPGADPLPRADGGVLATRYDLETNRLRLQMYNKFKRFKDTLLNPIETVTREPKKIFYVTVPIAILTFIYRVWPMLTGTADLQVRVLDDLIIQPVIFVFATFAIVREFHTRRIQRIEATIPDFLDRLASTNEAGMTFTGSLRRVQESDLGVLNEDIQGLLRDIDFGGRTERALHRFNERIGSSTIARIVALLSNALRASGDIGPVIRIAADEAREANRLKKERRQEMFLYIIVVYLAFFVFLGIAFAMQEVLITSLPTAEDLSIPQAGAIDVQLPIQPATGAVREAFILLLFHMAMIQAVVSGLVAGQMGEGTLYDGAKHVTVMLTIGYLLFLAFS